MLIGRKLCTKRAFYIESSQFIHFTLEPILEIIGLFTSNPVNLFTLPILEIIWTEFNVDWSETLEFRAKKDFSSNQVNLFTLH